MLEYIVAALAGVLAALLTIEFVRRLRARQRATYADIHRWFSIGVIIVERRERLRVCLL